MTMPPDMIDRVFGSYRIEAKIGAGGMGEVFRAHDAKLDRQVALKLLPADVASDPDRLRRFRAEARAASSINHPHILVIHDFGEVDGRPFIVSELVEGDTLRERLARGPIAPREALHVATQVAAALAAAHARGIVHRDIKPENVMIRPDGYIKVLDFGLMKLMPSGEVTDLTATEPGRVMGTPHYMSPEQARGMETGPSTDVWSVGVLLYEMLAGRPPFSGPSGADVIAAILQAEPTPVVVHSPQMPEPLAQIVATALRKDSTQRYRSAVELHASLATVQGHFDPDIPIPVAAAEAGRHPIVGRDHERSAVVAAFGRVTAGRGLLLSISGEPGSGKSTLAEDALRALRGVDGRCLVGRGRCSERLAGAEAYLPVLESLDSLIFEGGPGVQEQIKAIAPAWFSQVVSAGSDPNIGSVAPRPFGVSQERLKRELTALLRELSRGRPLVLFFEDVHWADASTIDLLAYIAARFDELRVLVIVSSRPSDLLLANHPFLALRRDLQARQLCHEMTLDMLTLADVERYLTLEFVAHRFPAALAELVYRKTEGSPLFMADLVRYLASSGTIAQDDGRWMLRGSLTAIGAELPESVRAMIERKIAQLTDDDRALLTAASVQGYEFDSAVVARVSSRDASAVEERLEALERVHGFVALVDERELPDGTLTARYRFVHVLYQNALYKQLRATRRVALNAGVAETLLQLHGTRAPNIAAELAALFEAARQPLRAAQYCLIATQNAARLFASHEVLRLATRGLALLDTASATPERLVTELGLLISLGNAFIALRGYAAGEVLDTYTRALRVSEQLGETQDRAAVLYGFAAYHLVGGRHPQALSMARELLAFTERRQHPAVIVAHRLVGWALLAMGQTDGALTHLERGRALYDSSAHDALAYSFGQEPGMAVTVMFAVGLQIVGRADEARQVCAEALNLARQTSHANSRCYVLYFASLCTQCGGDRDQTRSLADEALRVAEDQGLALWIGWSRIMRGWALADAGDLDTGLAEMRSGIDAAQALGHELCHSYYLALLAEMLMRAGRWSEAATALDETDRMLEVNEERLFAPMIARLRARLLIERRDRLGSVIQ
jgi:tetratricopeptide (TPR) repeat protein